MNSIDSWALPSHPFNHVIVSLRDHPTRAIPRLLAFLLLLLLNSCSNDKTTAPMEEATLLPTEVVSGTVQLPADSPLNTQTLTVVAASGEGSVSDKAAFSVEVPKDHFGFLYVLDENDAMVAATYAAAAEGLRITPESTAEALVMMFPVDWGRLGMGAAEVLAEIRRDVLFNELKTYTEQLMITDPSGLMDYEAHPTVLRTAAQIAMNLIPKEIRHSWQDLSVGDSGQGTSALLDPPRVVDVRNSPDVRIINPRAAPYGASAFEIESPPRDPDSYTFGNWPAYVNGVTINWWILRSEGDIRYQLGDGRYLLMLSRANASFFTGPPLGAFAGTLEEFRNAYAAAMGGDYLEIIRADARLKGTLGGLLYVTARSMGIASVLDPTEATGLVQIVIDYGGDAVELFTDVVLQGRGPENAGGQAAVKWLARTASNTRNSRAIAQWAGKHGVKLSAKAVEKATENLTVILDVLSAVEDAILLMAFMVDLGFAPQDVVFTVSQTDGNAEIVSNAPPSSPEISGSMRATAGQEVMLAVRATDPEGDDLRYLIGYGDGADDESPMIDSGSAWEFTHVWEAGNYAVYASATDARGGVSPVSDAFLLSVSPAGGFVETFETYPLGGFETNEIWDVNYKLPSEVRITGDAYQSNRALRFLDYDPDIGDEEGYYAVCITTLSENPTSIEFALQFNGPGDTWGIRAWKELGQWDTIAYYVTIDEGQLKWVRYGRDSSDPEDFIPVSGISQSSWHRIRLEIEWAQQQYDLYLDGRRVAQGCDFVSSADGGVLSSAPYVQALAFTDASCKSVLIDEVSIRGTAAHALSKMSYNSGVEVRASAMIRAE